MAKNTFKVDEQLNDSFNFEMLKRSLVYVKKEKVLFFKALGFETFAILVALLIPLSTRQILDNAIPNGDYNSLFLYCFIILLCIAINVFFTTITNRYINTLGQNIVYDIRKDLYEHLQKLTFSYFDSRPHGKILVRVINYVNSVSNMLSNGLIYMFLRMFNLIFILIFMLTTSPSLTLIVLAGLPFAIAFVFIIKPMQRKGWQEYSNKSSNMNAYVNESITCMKISQLFSREKYNTDVYETLSKEAKSKWYKGALSATSVGPMIDLIGKVVSAILIVYGIYFSTPMVTFGTLLAMMQYSNQFWQPIVQLANIYNTFINNIAYLERILETIDEPVEVSDVENASTLPNIKGAVDFDNVSFEYEKGIKVLKNVSFNIKAGESVALVGHTGSGKTTIINLISRFYNCTEGKVLIDGKDIADVTLASLRGQMGLMMQESFVFTGTVLDNLRYGNLNADDATLKRAAELVCADTFINELPHGYDTMLTEGGSILSQGEKQMLALARTMASDPKILILDEATSSVDTKTERALQQGVNQMLKDRTSFIVAHRLSTIKACDKIMFISKGEIAECGTHDELFAQKGFYYELCMQQ